MHTCKLNNKKSATSILFFNYRRQEDLYKVARKEKEKTSKKIKVRVNIDFSIATMEERKHSNNIRQK